MIVTLDTNVLARAVVDDDRSPGQCMAARKALASATSAFIPQVVQVELCWVLESSFGLRHAEIVDVMRALQGNPRIELEHRKAFDATLDRYARDAAWGFSDCLIATLAAQHNSIVLTFDKRLARLAGAKVLR